MTCNMFDHNYLCTYNNFPVFAHFTKNTSHVKNKNIHLLACDLFVSFYNRLVIIIKYLSLVALTSLPIRFTSAEQKL